MIIKYNSPSLNALVSKLPLEDAELTTQYIADNIQLFNEAINNEIIHLSLGTDEAIVEYAREASHIVNLSTVAGRHHIEYIAWVDQIEILQNKADMIQEAIFYAKAALNALVNGKQYVHLHRATSALDILKSHTDGILSPSAHIQPEVPVNLIANHLAI